MTIKILKKTGIKNKNITRLEIFRKLFKNSKNSVYAEIITLAKYCFNLCWRR